MKYYFRCPKCGNDEEFAKPTEDDAGLGCAIFLFFGLLPGLVYGSYRRRRIQCLRCLHLFRQPPMPCSPLSNFATSFLAVTIVFGLVIAALLAFPDFATILPSVPTISTIEEEIVAAPRVAAYSLPILLIMLFLSWGIAACVSDRKFRKQLSTECRLFPPPSKPPGDA